jgi:hypothetical protein
LRGERDEKDGDVVLEDLAGRDLACDRCESIWASGWFQVYQTGGLTSTLRISRTRLSDTRPCFKYCSIVAHNMLYVYPRVGPRIPLSATPSPA